MSKFLGKHQIAQTWCFKGKKARQEIMAEFGVKSLCVLPAPVEYIWEG